VNNLNYVTYQTFPAFTANSIQTISNIKYFIRNGLNVSLYFPLREPSSTEDINKLKDFYSINEDFEAIGIKHNLPFGKVKSFNRIWFLISHFVWSYKTVKGLHYKKNSSDFFFTRSDWVFYFLSRYNRNVIYECHQYTKIRKYLIYKSLKRENSKIIFLNENLKIDYEKKYKLNINHIVLHNGVDLEHYVLDVSNKKNKNELIFIGKLTRFGKSRDIDFLLQALDLLDTKYTLKIVGAKKLEINYLKTQIKEMGIENRVYLYKHVNFFEVSKHLSKSSIGILINSSSNTHSTSYTSPLKYFEYLAAGLKIIAVDFPSHRNLPFSENIRFYEEGDFESFVSAIKKLEDIPFPNNEILRFISLDTRAKKIINFLRS